MKAVSLFSGGLDSQIAVCVLQDQGIEVEAVNFVTPFFGANQATIKSAEALGVKLHTIDISEHYMEDVLRHPVYGFGKNLNPCIDCHAYMLKNAGQYMHTISASFLATGEVVGQRPMSQNKSALSAVDKLSGMRGYILRPLSARLLPPTIPEEEGWVDRERLLDINGRSRARQMELARHYGIVDYPSPAGGCLLTDANFSKRLLKAMETHQELSPADIAILKMGRHFCLDDNSLLVVGRNHSENERMNDCILIGDYLLKIVDRPGPLGLLRMAGTHNHDIIEYAAAIVARYSDAREENIAQVQVAAADGSELETLYVKPLAPGEVPVTV